MELVDAIIAGVGVVAAGGGYAIGRYKARFRWPMQEPKTSAPPLAKTASTGHVHRFDTMHSDGWWRCECDEPAPDHKQPQLKAVR